MNIETYILYIVILVGIVLVSKFLIDIRKINKENDKYFLEIEENLKEKQKNTIEFNKINKLYKFNKLNKLNKNTHEFPK